MKNDKRDVSVQKSVLTSLFILIPLLTFLTYSAAFYSSRFIDDTYQVGTSESWINFSGAILGGSITLLALAITITYQEKLRVNENKRKLLELDITHAPFLEIKSSKPNNVHTYFHGYGVSIGTNNHNNEASYVETLEFIIHNISDNTALSPKFEKFEYFDSYIYQQNDMGEKSIKKQDISFGINESIKSIKLIQKNGSVPIKVTFQYSEEFKKNSMNNQLCIRFRSTLVYYGISKQIKYKLHFSFIVYFDQSDLVRPIIDGRHRISNFENTYEQIEDFDFEF